MCEIKDFCNVNMPSDNTKILQFNQYQKSDKATCIIYADLKCIIEKIDGCKNNPETGMWLFCLLLKFQFSEIFSLENPFLKFTYKGGEIEGFLTSILSILYQ